MAARRARIVGCFHLPQGLIRRRVEPTAKELAERLLHAEAGLDVLPHMPDYELERCEYCARPDWEATGNCLARVRAGAGPLGALALALEELHAACAGRRDDKSYRVLDAIGQAERQLQRLGITADGHRQHLASQRAQRARR